MNHEMVAWSRKVLKLINREMRAKGYGSNVYECNLCEDGTYKRDGYCPACERMLKERRSVKNSPWTAAAVKYFGPGPSQAAFGIALESAHREGRLHPEIADWMGLPKPNSDCPVCGMTSWTQAEADQCCASLEETDERSRNIMLGQERW